jgi:two-component system LytT family sensor kinase
MDQINTSFINKVELWLASITLGLLTLYLVMVIAGYGYYNENIHQYDFESKHLEYSYVIYYFLPFFIRYVTVFGCYLLLHFIVVKNLVNKTKIARNLMLGIGLFILSGIVWGATEAAITRYLFYDSKNIEPIVFKLFANSIIATFYLYAIYALYTFFKYNLSRILQKFNIQPKSILVVEDCFVLFTCWTVILLVLNLPGLPRKYSIVWQFVALPSIPLYAYGYTRIIPFVKSKNKGFNYYLYRSSIISGAVLIFTSLCYILPFGFDIYPFILFVFFDIISIVAISAPATWYIYNYRLSRSTELTGLKTALGQSSASLDFLRSQINPHFLFNALNTLYATALQENADRTSEGIQKLGDMMRFMLRENMQALIPLSREVDYLNNYIALQKLRTQTSAEIVIQTEIEEQYNDLQIAPMLLIPFVENAFKHGISLKEPSHIKITLYTKGAELFFDVHNSIHPKKDSDPEKDKSGIGLENVSDRLRLLYPNDHDLIIRESAKEFFIHLTLNLNEV